MKNIKRFWLLVITSVTLTTAVVSTPVVAAPNDWLVAIGIKDGQLIPIECTQAITDPKSEAARNPNCCGLNQMFQVVVNFSKIILALTGSAALLMFVYGGTLWIIAAGSQERITQGKAAMTAAAIGIAIILGSYLIVNFTIYALSGGQIGDVQKILGQTLGAPPSGGSGNTSSGTSSGCSTSGSAPTPAQPVQQVHQDSNTNN